MLTNVLERFVIGEAGAVWLFLVVALSLFGDTTRLLSRRNLVLLLLALPALPLVDILSWERYVGDPRLGWVLSAAFTFLFAVTAFMTAWSLFLSRRPAWRWDVNLSTPQLRLLLGLLVVVNAIVVLGRHPDDAGYYTNLGARRWLETGKMPYGDEFLRGDASPAHGAAATYGPLLYAAHMPFQIATGATWNSPDANPMDKTYVRPPILATQLTCLAFHLLGLWSIFCIGRQLRGPPTGLALAALFAASPYVMGLGGDTYLATGLVYVSHIAPTAVTLAAFAMRERPAACGALLAAAAGCLFFPVFFFPLFLGWFLWRRQGTLPFIAGFAGAGAVIGLVVIYFTGSIGDTGPIRLFLQSTLEHQEGSASSAYGQSLFSFWGNHPSLAAFWQQPMIGSGSLFKPTFLLFTGLCAAAFLLVRRRTVSQFALLVAAIAAGIQLWKTHAAGTYVEWYLPFLLIGLFAGTPADGTATAGDGGGSSIGAAA